MNQSDLNRAVVRATGETVETINHMGFSIADPAEVHFDPEPCDFDIDLENRVIDWDAVDAERRVAMAYQPAA